MESRFWQYAPRSRFEEKDRSRFGSWAGRQSFQRLASESLAERGIDPNLIPSLGNYRPDARLLDTGAGPRSAAELSFSGGRPEGLGGKSEPAAKAEHMLYWRAGQLYREGMDYEASLERARAELPSIGKYEQEAADVAFMDLLKENRKWPKGQDVQKTVETFWRDWEGTAATRRPGDWLFAGATPQERVAYMQTLSQIDVEGMSDDEKRSMSKNIKGAVRSQTGLKVLGITIDESTLIWGALFPEFTAGMLVGEAAARPIGREIGGERGEEIAAMIGGMAGGVSLPRLTRFAARAGGKAAVSRLAPEAAEEARGAGGFIPGGKRGVLSAIGRVARLSDSDLVALRKVTNNPDILDAANAEVQRRLRVRPPGQRPEGDALIADISEGVSPSAAEIKVSESFREEQIERMTDFVVAVESELRGEAWRPPGASGPPRPPKGPAAELSGAGPPGRIPVADTAAREMLQFKEETLWKAGQGPFTGLPIIRNLVAVAHPGTAMSRIAFVAGNAKRGAASVVETQLRTRMKPALDSLRKAWDTHRPKYIGPKKNTHKDTLKDYGDHPEHYADVHPSIESAVAEINKIDYFRIGLLRSGYGVDLGAYAPKNPKGFYSPTVESKLSFEKGVEALERGMVEGPYVEPAPATARRLATGRTKTRVYEGAYERSVADPTFHAETDIETLFEVHDSTMARLAGWNTFRMGTEGLTRLQVAEQLYPKLVLSKLEVGKLLTSLRGRLTTAVHKARGLGVAEKKLTSLQRRALKKVDPIYEQIEKLGEEYGPELSYLSGEARALDDQIAALSKAVEGVAVKKAGIDVPGLKAGVKAAKERLNELRRRYENAGTGRYRLNENTRRYHTPSESEAIDTFLSPDLGKVGTAISDMMDTVRATAFFIDASLITIQGSLAMFFAPLVTLRHADQIMSQVLKGNALMEIAAREPEMVNAFARAQGRAFGFAGAEFFFRPIKFVNERLGGAVEVARYNMWKNDVELLRKWNPRMTSNVAEAEAANANSKMVPALNVSERGISPARARVERAPVVSPSFLLSPGLLMKDAASGLMKLGISRTASPMAAWGKLAGREQLALFRMFNFAGTTLSLSVATALLSAKERGWTPGEAVQAVVDPNSPFFMSLVLGKVGTISLGGPYRSFIRGITPRMQDGQIIPIPALPNLVRLARGKANPPFSAAIDLIRNKDYIGRKIITADYPLNVLQTLWYVAETFSPLSAGAVSERVRTGEFDLVGTSIEAASQLAGTSYREATVWDRLLMRRDELAMQEYGHDWDDLEYPASQRAALEKKYPEELARPDARTERGKALKEHRDIGVQYVALQERLDAQFPPGEDWRKGYGVLKDQQAGAYTGWEATNAETVAWLETLAPEDPNEQALADYRQAFDDAKTAWGDVDIDRLSAILDRLEATWTPKQKEYVDRETGIKDTPQVREYKADQRVLRPYWEIMDEAWTDLREQYPIYEPFATLDYFMQAQAQELLAMGVPQNQLESYLGRVPAVAEVLGLVSDMRFQYRLAHPEVDALLVKWGYATTPAAQQDRARPKGRFGRSRF